MRAILVHPAAASATALLLVAAPGWAADVPQDRLGRDLLRRDCAACHAVGRHDRSARRNAPPFRELSRRYDVDALSEALGEGLMTGHPEMPEFRFSPSEVDAILDYLRGLQAPAPRR